MVDNHTHLPVHEGQIPNVEGLRLTLDEQLGRAETAGVVSLITSGCELPELAGTMELTQKYASVFAALGIHPNETALHAGVVAKAPDGQTYQLQDHHREYSLEEAIGQVADLARNPKVLAIGETGLDYFRTSPAGKAAQQRGFAAHISLAKELDLPIQIHDRQAHQDTVQILRSEGAPVKTVFHCFSGEKELAQILAENHWYASFAGPLTYHANQYLRDALAVLPPELVLVETDAPYLTPHPHRGQPNASYMMPWTVRKIAEIWGRDEKSTCQQLLTNTVTVYGEKITAK